MLFKPDKIISAKKGLHLQELIRTREINADDGVLKKPIGWSIIFIFIRVALIIQNYFFTLL